MNQNILNDTLDNFSFSTSSRVSKPTNNGTNTQFAYGNSITSQDFNIIEENEGKTIGTISFDDSAFISESFTISEDKRQSQTRRSNEDLFDCSGNGSDIFNGFDDISNFSHAVTNNVNEEVKNEDVDIHVSGCDIFDDSNNGINNFMCNFEAQGDGNVIIERNLKQNDGICNMDELIADDISYKPNVNTLESTKNTDNELKSSDDNKDISVELFDGIDEVSDFTLNSEVKKDQNNEDVFKEIINTFNVSSKNKTLNVNVGIKDETCFGKDLQPDIKHISTEMVIKENEHIIEESQSNVILESDKLLKPSLKVEVKNTAIEERMPQNKEVHSEQNLKITEDENINNKPINNENNANIKSENPKHTVLSCDLADWNLPEMILQKYQKNKVKLMFEWQTECLSNENILHKNKNLVYSAPTSAGKTLVAEILGIKTLIERNKKVIFVLPFVSVVREKMFHFQDLLGTSGIRVEGFMGSYHPPGGFKTVQLAICTIEKANSLINRLLEDGELNDIGAVIIDEMHLLGDESRGYLLELLLTKLKYMTKKNEELQIQIIGMSATLPNLDVLAKWLDAELYTTSFRPIPLHELCHINGEIYDNNLRLIRKLPVIPELQTDTDNILQLCLETIKNSCSVLIFCPTKNWCENLSQQMAEAISKIGNSKTELGGCLRKELSVQLITELLEQLKRCPVGLDAILKKTISFAVAFHHAGLTMDERDIIEGGFRSGAIRILVATSTLSSGVNLPARRVIVRTPTFYRKPIDTLTYRQMIGRAGRMGKDTAGESLLICQKNDYKTVKELMSARLDPVESCLQSGKLKRAILEVVASGVASTPEDVQLFSNCTLLANESNNLENPVDESIQFLERNQFIRLQKLTDGSLKYAATSLAKACLSSSLPPEEGLTLFTELEKARQCFVLETELHLIYLVTPYSACNYWGTIDWMFFLTLWEKLPKSMKRVGELVGIKESFMVNASRGSNQNNKSSYQKLQIHKRFYTALALQDLVNEIPLHQVASKFSCSRGLLQSLQQSASTFAGMVTSFSKQLGWSSVELLISQFQDRLHFGINRDLLDLMRLPIMNGPRARALYNAGFQTLVQLAAAGAETIENVLHKVMPFESENQRDGESKYEADKRNKIRTVWVTGKQGLTERDAAIMFIDDARRYLQLEMGLVDAKWGSIKSSDEATDLKSDSMQESLAKLGEIGSSSDVKATDNNSSKEFKDNLEMGRNYNIGSEKLAERCNQNNLETPKRQKSGNKQTIKQEMVPTSTESIKQNASENKTKHNSTPINKIQNAIEKTDINVPKISNTQLQQIVNVDQPKLKLKSNLPTTSKIKQEMLPTSTESIKQNASENKTKQNSTPKNKIENAIEKTEIIVPKISNIKLQQRVDVDQPKLKLKSNLPTTSKIPKISKNIHSNPANVKQVVTEKAKIKNLEVLYPREEDNKLEKAQNIHPKSNVDQSHKVLKQDTKDDINNQFTEKNMKNANEKITDIQKGSDSGIETQIPNDQNFDFSDASLFESSFNTPDLAKNLNKPITEEDLSQSNDFELKLSLNNSDFATNVSFRNVSSSSTENTSSEFIASSQTNVQYVNSPLKLIELNNTTLRKRKLSENCVFSTPECISETPTKKKKIISKVKKTKRNIDPTFIITQDKSAYLDRTEPDISATSNLKQMDIVDVCDDENVFESFRAELQNKKELSLAVGCVEVQINKPKIGMKLIKNNFTEKKFSYGNKQLEGVSLSWGDNTSYYVSFSSNKIHSDSKISLLKQVLSNQSLKVRMFDSKEHIRMLALCLGVEFCSQIEDPKVGDWLLDPDGKEKNLQAMVLQYSPDVGKISQLAGISKGVGSVGLDIHNSITPRMRSSVEAITTWHLVHLVLNTLAELEMKLLHAYYIEMSSIYVLTKMELSGLGVNVSCLEKLSNTLMQQSFALERKAFEIAGRKFSFSSSTDVAKVVGIYRGKRISTSKQILENNDHPIAAIIVQWRKINSILTNTIYPLLRIVKNDRIYGCCITRNATGRISMHEPNLQNVPRTFEALNPSDNASLTINCREAFQTKDRYIFLSADYSQLELRLLAHLSKDELLISILNSNGDVFKSIAAKLNNTTIDMVNDDLRQKAKQICYGIIYGMGIKALADQMQTIEEEAAAFSETFHRTYPAVKKYIQDTIDGCKNNGYVETIAGRRRYLPNISHRNPATKSQAERQAVNTTIQGSAADIAKNAMVLIDNTLKQKFKESKHMPQLVLQLHDEFLYEVLEKYVNSVAKIVKNCMENSVKLSVPFPVKVKTGKTWGTLQEKLL